MPSIVLKAAIGKMRLRCQSSLHNFSPKAYKKDKKSKSFKHYWLSCSLLSKLTNVFTLSTSDLQFRIPLETHCKAFKLKVTPSSPFSPDLLVPLFPCSVCSPAPLAHLVPFASPCHPLLNFVTLCYPLIPFVTPCYPLLPLVTTCYLCYPCYPLLPLVTLCYPKLPLDRIGYDKCFIINRAATDTCLQR